MKLALFSISTLLIPLVTSVPVVNVDIHITDTQHALDSNPVTAVGDTIPGWVFIEENIFRARIHGNTFWNVKGKLAEPFPIDEFLFDPLLFTLNHPEDFSGSFNGTVGRGQISLQWPKSGATIVGRSPVGDFVIKGESTVDYSP